MKNLRKTGLVAAVLVVAAFFSACGVKKSDNVSVESVFPKDASIVWTLDYSNKGQVENFDALFAQFPDVGLAAKFKQGFNLVSVRDGFSWEKDVAPMFEGEWKAGFSVIVPEEIKSSGDFRSFESQDLNLYFAGKFEDGDAVRNFIEKMIDGKVDSWAGVEHEKKDGVDYWIKDGSGFYLVGYGDLFFITSSRKNVDEAIARIENGGGFNENQKYLLKTNSLAKKNFGYFFVSGRFFTNFYGESFEKLFGDGLLAERFKKMGDVFVFWTAEKDGFKLVSSTDFNDEAAIKDLVPDPDYRLSLIDKINGEGVFLYVESSGFGENLNSFADNFINGFETGFDAGFNRSSDEGVESSSSDNIDFSVDPKSLQTDLISPADEPELINAAEIESVRRDYIKPVVVKLKEFLVKIDVLLKSPVAFVMSDTGSYLSTMSFYFQLKESDKESAKKLLVELDAYVDEIITTMDEKIVAADAGGKTGLLKKDIEVVEGGGLHKLYFDWEVLPEVDVVDFEKNFGENFMEDFKIEIYYGLTGENTFVIAFYPDFPKSFGKNVLSSNKDYLSAVEKLNGIYGFDVFYFRTKPIVDLVDRYVVLVGKNDGLSEEEEFFYESKIKVFLNTMQYAIGSGLFKDNSLSQTIFIKIGK